MRAKLYKTTREEVTVDTVRISVDTDVFTPEECEALRATGYSGARTGRLVLLVDVRTRQVRDWPAGQSLHMYGKVVDAGAYSLLSGPHDDVVVSTDSEGYVPNWAPGGGDYLEVQIGPDGVLAGLDASPKNLQAWIDEVTEQLFKKLA